MVEEVIMILALQNVKNSFLIEQDPEKADLYYGSFCISVSAMGIRSSYKRDFFLYYKPLLESMGSYYQRYGGVDHVLIQMPPAYHIHAPIRVHNCQSIPFMATMIDIPKQLPDRELWHFTQQFHGTNAPLYFINHFQNLHKN